MAIELVTGHSGAAHVSGADAGAMHAGICGSDSYVLGAVPSVTMSDANTLTIQPCDLMVEGRHVRLSGTNTLSIRSGAQTGKRNDLVYVRYSYDASTGTESAKLGVKEGTTATTATDPALDNPSSVLDGATIADVAIARVSLDALTPTATWLLPQLPTLKALGDSASLMIKKFSVTGSANTGKTTDLYVNCKVNGWVPLFVADVSSNHAGTFSINQATITSDGKVYVTVYQPLSNWTSVTINCTVLYATAPFIVSREYI